MGRREEKSGPIPVCVDFDKVVPADHLVRQIDAVLDLMATLRFAAFNQKTTPEIDGEIGAVSADITQEQRTGASYYTARVLLKPEEIAKLGSAKLVPGMPVDVFIKRQGRTALSYLVKPLRDGAGRAFKER